MGRFRKKFYGSAVGKVSQYPEKKVHLSISGLFQEKKQGGWENAFVNAPLKFPGLSWKFWKNRSSFHKSVQHLLKIPRPKKGTPKLCGSVYVCLSHSCRYEHNQSERRDGKLGRKLDGNPPLPPPAHPIHE